MVAYNKAPSFLNYLGQGDHDLVSDTLKIFLARASQTTSTSYNRYHATTTASTILTEITTSSGYTDGGQDTANGWGATGSGYECNCTSTLAWTAANSGWDTFNIVGLYNDSTVTTTGDQLTDELVGYWIYGSSVALASGDSFTVTFSNNRLFTIGV